MHFLHVLKMPKCINLPKEDEHLGLLWGIIIISTTAQQANRYTMIMSNVFFIRIQKHMVARNDIGCQWDWLLQDIVIFFERHQKMMCALRYLWNKLDLTNTRRRVWKDFSELGNLVLFGCSRRKNAHWVDKRSTLIQGTMWFSLIRISIYMVLMECNVISVRRQKNNFFQISIWQRIFYGVGSFFSSK